MEKQKYDWTSAHAQLWTSFKKTQKRNVLGESVSTTGVDMSTNANLIQTPQQVFGHDVFLSILDEVTKIGPVDKPILSGELEHRIVELIESCETEPSIRMLLTAIIHMKGHITRINARSVCLQESLAGVLSESMFHLCGQRQASLATVVTADATCTTTTTAANNANDEKCSEDTEALASIESRFFSVLLQIEECKKTVRTLTENFCSDGTLSCESSIQEMLSCLSVENLRTIQTKDLGNDDKAILSQVMDILEAPEGCNPNNVPNLALGVMRELEFVRRENQLNSTLLVRYERTVMSRLASYGIISFPTLEQERAAMLSNDKNDCSSADDQWIRDDLAALITTMLEVDSQFHLNNLPGWLQKGPLDSSAEAMLEYLHTSITGAKNLLMVLGRDVMDAKGCVTDILRKLSRGEQTSDELRITFVEDGLLMDAIHQLKNIIEDQVTRCQPFLEMLLEGCSEKTSDALMRIARWLPESDLNQIIEIRKNGGAVVDYMEGALKRLVIESNLQDHILFHVERLSSQITNLANNNVVGGNGLKLLDEASMSSLMDTVEKLKVLANDRNEANKRVEDVILQQGLYELAQLLPTGVTPSSFMTDARIDPPVSNILDMVRLLKRRLEQWNQEQQKQKLSGAQSRLEKARIEEIVRERSKQIVKITKEILVGTGNLAEMEEVLGALPFNVPAEPTGASVVVGGSGNSGNAVYFVTVIFDDLEERLKLVKTRHYRLLQSYSANKVRLDNLAQSNITHSRRWSRICSTLAAICRIVGLDNVANRLEHDPKVDAMSSKYEVELRPELRKSHLLPPVTDADVLEVLKLVEESLKGDEKLGDFARQVSTLRRLQEEEKCWLEERDTFLQAMQMILLRLAEAGRRIKRSLFMLGTDESPEDEVVEGVICNKQQPEQEFQKTKEMKKETDTGYAAQKQNMCEQSLAVLLQKFGRWATRLQETTEDHLYTQQKLTKYFGVLHRFFCGSGDNAVAARNMSDSNLIDADTMLMQFADDILPLLDQAIMTAKTVASNDEIAHHCSTGKTQEGETVDVRHKALSLLLQDFPAARMLSMDHRLVRLYESIGRLRTVVDGLLSVRYLSIPKTSRRRGRDMPDELIFDDVWGDSYIELDFGGPKGKTATAAIATADAGGDEVPVVHEDELFRAVENNIRTVHQALCKFSTNYKLAVILLQKDTDLIQEFIASMLEPYAELDLGQTFKQDPLVLNEMLLLLKERGTLQRGCYFFNRIGGEGPSLWTTALEQLSVGFLGTIEMLRKRTRAAVELRGLFDDVVDLCVMYVNWVDMGADFIQPLIPFSEDVLNGCVREDERMETGDVRREEQDGKRALKPPLPQTNQRGKVAYFSKDEVVLNVIAHMFQFIQEVVTNKGKRGGNHIGSNADGNDDAGSQGGGQLDEQLQLLREAAAAAEQRANAAIEECKHMEQGRDKALSEAAISRAELRRWKRLYGIAEDQTPPQLPQLLEQELKQRQVGQSTHFALREQAATVTTVDKPVPVPLTMIDSLTTTCKAKDAILLEVAHSVKELTEQLRDACQQGIVPLRRTVTDSSSLVETIRSKSPRATGTQLDLTPKSRQCDDTPLSGSGVVRTKKKKEILTRQKSFSPRSSLSVFSSDIRGTTGEECSQKPRCNNHSEARQRPGKLKEVSVDQVTVPALSASVVVSPMSQTYSSLARDHQRVRSNGSPVLSAERYQPNKHSGVFFNDCDVCYRHHNSDYSANAMGGTVSSSSLRLHSPRDKAAYFSSSMTLRAGKTTPGASRHARMKIDTSHCHHNNQSPSALLRAKPRVTSTEVPLSELGKKGLRASIPMRRRHSSASVSPDAYDSYGRQKQNHHHHHHHLQQRKEEQDKINPSYSHSFSRRPSTSTVLSPESDLGLSDVMAWEQQKTQSHSHTEKNVLRGQEQNKKTSSRHLEKVKGDEAATLGDSIEFIGQKMAVGTSLKPTKSSTQNKNTRHRPEQDKQQQHAAAALTRSVRTTENYSRNSEAIARLTDVVARTRISGREEI